MVEKLFSFRFWEAVGSLSVWLLIAKRDYVENNYDNQFDHAKQMCIANSQ
jgi:hypothetical protein